MKRLKTKRILATLPATLIIAALLALNLAGCRPAAAQETSDQSTATEITAAETSEEAAEDTKADTGVEEFNPDDFGKDRITGNINMLTGIELSSAVLAQRPIAIMVENTPDARPQSGLISADVVYEVVDEAGITRFVAVFSSQDSDMVGPVRSARPYYAEIAASFDPVYIFWGTHPNFYKIISDLGIDYLFPVTKPDMSYPLIGNFDDPGSGEGKDAIRDTTRVAPHNAYVRIPRMREIAESLGYSADGGQTSFYFKEDAPESERGNISDITVNFSSNTFKVDFKYDSATNKYLRYCADAPSMDRESGEQISVNNVLVLFTDIRNSGNKEGHMIIRTTQGGDAYYFLDGNVVEGTWGRYSALDPFEFKDKDGKPVLINRGQTWVVMISGIEQLEY
ncbi:MAG: DUF3048 domain-containing protein [Actinobacteria bacterium]|nr:DUF3048 domain-containing protein [Actinomycetota bacterium]